MEWHSLVASECARKLEFLRQQNKCTSSPTLLSALSALPPSTACHGGGIQLRRTACSSTHHPKTSTNPGLGWPQRKQNPHLCKEDPVRSSRYFNSLWVLSSCRFNHFVPIMWAAHQRPQRFGLKFHLKTISQEKNRSSILLSKSHRLLTMLLRAATSMERSYIYVHKVNKEKTLGWKVTNTNRKGDPGDLLFAIPFRSSQHLKPPVSDSQATCKPFYGIIAQSNPTIQ